MKDFRKITKFMEKEGQQIIEVLFMKANIKMGKEKVKESKYIKMEIFTKGNFWMINNMEKEK